MAAIYRPAFGVDIRFLDKIFGFAIITQDAESMTSDLVKYLSFDGQCEAAFAPLPRAVEAVGRILPTPILGGLHHHYVRT
jgi:hypothetical protein